MAKPTERVFLTDAAGSAVIQMHADFFDVKEVPAGCKAQVMFGDNGEWITMDDGMNHYDDCDPWDVLHIQWTAVPGKQIRILVGKGCRGQRTTSGPDKVDVNQGLPGAQPWPVKLYDASGDPLELVGGGVPVAVQNSVPVKLYDASGDPLELVDGAVPVRQGAPGTQAWPVSVSGAVAQGAAGSAPWLVAPGVDSGGNARRIRTDANGIVSTYPQLDNGNLVYAVSQVSDAYSGGQAIASGQLQFNESVFERRRGNTSGVIATSQARNGTWTSAMQTNRNGRGLHLTVHVSQLPGSNPSQTLGLLLWHHDPVTGGMVQIHNGITINSSGVWQLHVYPGVVAPAGYMNGAVLSLPMPRHWWCQLIPSVSGSGWDWVGGVGASIIL